MRIALLAATLALSACAALQPSETIALLPADAATALVSGERLTMARTLASGGGGGQDALIVMALTHADGRALRFEEANHTPHDVMAQAPGGPLAQAMGLFGEERPTLYTARAEEHRGAPFLCGPEGPAALGVYTGADGTTRIFGLKQSFSFETRPDGSDAALPFSPDQICARLRFTRGS